MRDNLNTAVNIDMVQVVRVADLIATRVESRILSLLPYE